MRISDWSSDVCSSDLQRLRQGVAFACAVLIAIDLLDDILHREIIVDVERDGGADGRAGDEAAVDGRPPIIAAGDRRRAADGQQLERVEAGDLAVRAEPDAVDDAARRSSEGRGVGKGCVRTVRSW